MESIRIRIISALGLVVLTAGSVMGAGVSVDAGLTPPEDRWIIRNQLRYMPREDDKSSTTSRMSMYVFPTVVAYGVTSDFAVMLRQSLKHRDMDMMGNNTKDTGADDLFVLGKYKLFRRNTNDYTLGLAGTLGFELPTGADAFSSDTVDVVPGLYSSWRSGALAADLQVAYKWSGFAGRSSSEVDPGNEFKMDFALAHQFNVTEDGSKTIAPLVELTYMNVAADRIHGSNLSDSGENVFYISPGLKYTQETFIIEGVVRIPVWQDQSGSQTERKIGFIVGTRFMF